MNEQMNALNKEDWETRLIRTIICFPGYIVLSGCAYLVFLLCYWVGFRWGLLFLLTDDFLGLWPGELSERGLFKVSDAIVHAPGIWFMEAFEWFDDNATIAWILTPFVFLLKFCAAVAIGIFLPWRIIAWVRQKFDL